MIKRLRPRWSDNKLKKIYSEPHDHWRYGRGHGLRVEFTKVITKDIARELSAKSVADLSCGNGDIAKSLNFHDTYLGDYAPGYTFTGPLEKTLLSIPGVDLYICSETLEHLDDPIEVLKQIRNVSKGLIVTTPINCWGDANEEHYWAWDRDGVESMFEQSGWVPNVYVELDSTVFQETYTYGIWGCK